MHEFTIKTSKREEIVDITENIKKVVSESKEAKNGKICFVYVPHASCAVIINENYDKNLCEDIQEALRSTFPRGKWRHDKLDGNADSHIKASIIGPGKFIPLEKCQLKLGRW